MKTMEIQKSLVTKLSKWLGDDNLRYFKHLKGLKGTYCPVLKLNKKRKGIPAHPVHLREGMQIRNWMRGQDECKDWSGHDFDNNWTKLIDLAIKKRWPKKCIVITVSRQFLKQHPRSGDETGFLEKIRKQIKKHTIRGNYEWWKKRIDMVVRDEAYLSIRYWTGSPYNYQRDGSKQAELVQLHAKDGVGIEKLDLTRLGWFIDDVDNDLTLEELSKNDGLSKQDFIDWFDGELKIDMDSKAIIHFTDFRYGG